MLENNMVRDELFIENDAEEYLEYLLEEDDRNYDDYIFEKMEKEK